MSTMQFLVALSLFGLAAGAVVVAPLPVELDYHNKVGIPLAERIKATERAQDFDGARIVGGAPANLGQYPYLGGLVVLLSGGRESVCGSSLVTATRAVTAAHCWRGAGGDAARLTLVLGSLRLFSGGTRVVTSDVEVHGGYDQSTLANDVALIRFPRVNFNNNIRSIPLAGGNHHYVGSWAWGAGFGLTSDTASINDNAFLSHVQVQVIDNAECALTYPGFIQGSTLCVATAGGRGTCAGDSGGPLVLNNQLIGITSFGPRGGCQLGLPAGFARVTSFAAWIRQRL